MNNEIITIEQELHNIAAAFEQAGLYYGHGTETAWDEAAWLLAHALGLSPQNGQLQQGTPISVSQIKRIREIADLRIETRKPLAYLINSAWFCGLEFYVDERVIVPRSPIAELIANDFKPWVSQTPRHILDLCTGCGCIAIACAVQFPEAVVWATDINLSALDVARVNIERHGVKDRIALYEADLFDGLPEQKFDLIICNPPYVDAADMAQLPPEFGHEPAQALAAGKDGLVFVRRILHDAVNFLPPDGVLVCEVGNSQNTLCEAYPRWPFTWIEFEHGGFGVFALTAGELEKGRSLE